MLFEENSRKIRDFSLNQFEFVKNIGKGATAEIDLVKDSEGNNFVMKKFNHICKINGTATYEGEIMERL